MNRRESLKSLLIGAVATGAAATGCTPDTAVEAKIDSDKGLSSAEDFDYGRTPSEKVHDIRVMSEQFFTESEMKTISVLSDIILPANETAGSATEAEVPAFIEFIVKDMPHYQTPLRGGLMWLEKESFNRFEKSFVDLDEPQQMKIVDEIAFPAPKEPTKDEDKVRFYSNFPNPDAPPPEHGRKFFNTLRDLVVTGYYTTKMGFEDLGYEGNRANVWDGVPEEVLEAHGVAYDPEWIAKCVDQSKREVIAEWDDDMNLIT